jgi:hypothetical protein
MEALKIIKEELRFPNIAQFQRTWNLGPALHVDGILGPKTKAAAQESWDRHQDHEGDVSAHFSAHEFACGCGGKFKGCQKLLCHRELLKSLESLRTVYAPGGLTIVSGYRCPTHNEKVGGVQGSMHLQGLAVDIPPVANATNLRSHGWFAGYGVKKSGMIVHVDRRDILGKYSRGNPAVWTY